VDGLQDSSTKHCAGLLAIKLADISKDVLVVGHFITQICEEKFIDWKLLWLRYTVWLF
jgi:hypothetical protein